MLSGPVSQIEQRLHTQLDKLEEAAVMKTARLSTHNMPKDDVVKRPDCKYSTIHLRMYGVVLTVFSVSMKSPLMGSTWVQ